MADQYIEREWIDLYDADEKYVGRFQRGDRYPEGSHNYIVCVFTLNSKGEILLTRRAMNKSWPGFWENTAGACLSGEDPRESARRELEEETGILADPDDLVFLGKLPSINGQHLLHAFFLHRDLPIEEVRLQKGETMDAKWVPMDLSLVYEESLAEPVRYRLLYYWHQLISYAHPQEGVEPWLTWAKTLQFYAQQGLEYTRDPFDKERFEGIRQIASQMMAEKTGLTTEKVLGLFAGDKGYQTPKVEVRAAVFREDRVLLVLEGRNEEWSLPGGWCDAGISLGKNAEKECMEEAGIAVTAQRLVTVQNRSENDYKEVIPYEVYKCYVNCQTDWVGEVNDEGIEVVTDFKANPETKAAAFFPIDRLPLLSSGRVNEKSIRLCYEAYRSPQWETHFD